MVKIELATHQEVLSKQGDKFYIAGDRVYATMCVDGTIAYTCLTDEDPSRALELNDNRLNNALKVAGFDIG